MNTYRRTSTRAKYPKKAMKASLQRWSRALPWWEISGRIGQFLRMASLSKSFSRCTSPFEQVKLDDIRQ
jgi:hypothetical protein